MEEKLKFVARLLDGDKMAPLCTVTYCGRLCLFGKKINLSQVLSGQNVGIKEVDDKVWLVSFMDYDLGYFDEQTCNETFGQPFWV